MNYVSIKLIKQTYKMDDGNLISGVQVVLAPMIYKFISLNKQKLDLLEEIRPDFYQWFYNSPDNSVMVLQEHMHSGSISLPNYSPDPNNNEL